MKDLLVATARRKKKSCAGVAYDYMKDGYCADDLKVLNVTELRIKLNDLGLDVDGSREAMIEALKCDEDSEEGSYVKVDEGSGVSREEGENDGTENEREREGGAQKKEKKNRGKENNRDEIVRGSMERAIIALLLHPILFVLMCK